jgi:uncharacterized protein (UPF0335 family)
MLYIQTSTTLHVFHFDAIPRRKVCAWSIKRAIERLERGEQISMYAQSMGFDEKELRNGIRLAGYAPNKREQAQTKRQAKVAKGFLLP